MWTWGKIEDREQMEIPTGRRTGEKISVFEVKAPMYDDKDKAIEAMANGAAKEPGSEFVLVKVAGKLTAKVTYTFTEVE
jgi:hypothetical protein